MTDVTIQGVLDTMDVTISGVLTAIPTTIQDTLSAVLVTMILVETAEYEYVPWLDHNGDEIVDHNGDTIMVKVPV